MELQAYRIYTRRDEGAWGYCPFAEPTDVELNDEQVYIKSETDRYITRQKYKRCVAMAELCQAKYDKEDAKVNGRGASWDYTSPEMKYWERWSNRWLILSDKFKEDL